MDIKSNIVNLFKIIEEIGSNKQYGNEKVSQLEHAIQCALLAKKNNENHFFITAALFHDIGHLINNDKEAIKKGIDKKHENSGSFFLSRFFPEDVTRLIKGHVPAKRYLVYYEKGYYETLSIASKKSLDVQGGSFSTDEANDFIKQPFMQDAVRLRKYDDLAKVENLEIPNINFFYKHVESSFK